MAWYRTKNPILVKAITFNEFVQYGRDNGANIVNDMPWSFKYDGYPVTHENDECYLISNYEEIFEFTPNDMLITYHGGNIGALSIDEFIKTYEIARTE